MNLLVNLYVIGTCSMRGLFLGASRTPLGLGALGTGGGCPLDQEQYKGGSKAGCNPRPWEGVESVPCLGQSIWGRVNGGGTRALGRGLGVGCGDCFWGQVEEGATRALGRGQGCPLKPQW